MREFAYSRAVTPNEAVGMMASASGAKYLGGGTNLLDLMKLDVESPDVLIDVSRLTTTEITDLDDGALHVGAASRNSDLAVDPRVRERFPVLSEALLAGASGQLRNAADLGGNLLQRTRCRYFKDTSSPCNKRVPGSGCPAIRGEHHTLAIFEGSAHCVATHPSDMAVALTALDATVHLEEAAGPRSISIHELYRAPGDTPELDTTLHHDALITGISLDPTTVGWPSTYRKIRERASFAFALVSLAALLRVEHGRVVDLRLALGGVAHRPWRARVAEARLRGAPVSVDSFAAAIDDELAAATPLRDNAFKVRLVHKVVIATLAQLSEIHS